MTNYLTGLTPDEARALATELESIAAYAERGGAQLAEEAARRG